jgi:transposase
VAEVSMFAIDLAKSVLQVAGCDGAGKPVLCKAFRRGQVLAFFARQAPSVIGMEACGSAHHWARELGKLGHEVKLIPAQYVKAYLKRGKTDARDAEAILEAMQRPTMRFVAVKSVEQQCDRALQAGRDVLVRQRTQLGNAIRGLLYEMGIIAPQGVAGLDRLLAMIEAADSQIPAALLAVLLPLATQWRCLDAAVESLDRRLVAQAKANPDARRLMKIGGVGPASAHAVIAAIGDGKQFRSARDFAAWVGLTPNLNGTGGKTRCGHISKKGDDALRRLLVLGAASVVRQAKTRPERASPWLRGVLARRPAKVAIVAQAAKTARILWAVLTSGQDYRTPAGA